MLVSFVYVVACRVLEFVVLLVRDDRSKELEIVVLRHQLSILRRQTARPRLASRDRLVLSALSRVLPRRSWHSFFVTPETLLRWHKRIVARRWTYPHRQPGRPPLDQTVRELILRLARENAHWGYVRIAGELRKLGITVSATLVRNVLARAGVPSAPQRAQLSWGSFLRSHAAHHARLRFLHRRHGSAAAAVRALLHLDRQTPARVRRLHEQPGHGLDDAAGAEHADGAR